MSNRHTRYANWDKQVRHAMIWAGSADPALLFEQNKAEDPKPEGRLNLLASWYDAYSNNPMHLRDVLSETEHVLSYTDGEKDEHLRNIKEAIQDILPNGKVISRNLGTVIGKFARQWIDGHRIMAEESGENSRKSKKWYVERQQD